MTLACASRRPRHDPSRLSVGDQPGAIARGSQQRLVAESGVNVFVLGEAEVAPETASSHVAWPRHGLLGATRLSRPRDCSIPMTGPASGRAPLTTARDDQRKRAAWPDPLRPVLRHDVGACELPIGGSSSTVAVAMRHMQRRGRARRGARDGRAGGVRGHASPLPGGSRIRRRAALATLALAGRPGGRARLRAVLLICEGSGGAMESGIAPRFSFVSRGYLAAEKLRS